MRRWQTAALSLCAFLLGCNASPSTSEVASPPATVAARPTPAGPTPSLPVARPIASPSPSASPAAGAAPKFALTSSAFTDGSQLPAQYTCDGASQSPPLAWTGAPAGTTAYALVEQDMDSPPSPSGQPFTLWLLYNMPDAVTQLPEAVPPRPLLSNGVQQGLNDKQSVGYLAACPDHGQPPHHLTFSVFAQDAFVTLETGAAYDSVHDALTGHTLGQAKLGALVHR